MQRILYKIDKEWDTGIINIQEYADMVDLVHKDYYDILYKYTESEYTRARKIAEKKVDRQITRMVTKSKKDVPIKINKIEEENGLWGTIPETRTDIEHMTFVASDKTMQRVKADKITKILHKGYVEGLNGKEVGRHIRVGFSKLKGYEAERIARTELHSAHEKGLLDQYKDMNVKYKQWDAHIDRRTRDEHIHLNGEITTIDGTFTNGLKNPGDKNGPIKEWINCRCTSDPYLMPIGKQAPPGATHFREEDLIDVDTGFNLDDYTLEDAITGNWGINNALNVENNLVKVLDSNSWRFTEEDNLLIKNLRAKRKEMKKKLGLGLGQSGLSESENQLLAYLKDKKFFNRFYNNHLDSPLSYNDSKEIINLRKKHGWNVELNRSGLSPMSYERNVNITNRYGEVSSLSRKYRLTKSEEKELENLLYKRLFNQGKLNSSDSSRLEFLYDKKQFNYLYSLNKQNKGISYNPYKEFQRLFNKLKTKLNLEDNLLEIPLPNHNKNIKFYDNGVYNRFSKKTKDGMLPDNERIEDWFTLNAKDLTPREEEVADRWLGADYRYFADYFASDKDVHKFAKRLENKYDELLEINKKAIAKGEKPPIEDFTLDNYMKYKKYPDKALNQAESIAYDWITLENILNNQTKQGIMTFRVQEEHFLGNDIWEGKVIELRDCLSTAVTKDGALWFSATNNKEMKYLIEYEMPAGTNGAYLAPIKKGEIINPNSPYFGDPYAYEMEFLLNEYKVKIIELDKRTEIGALGEELKVIKLRIIR